MTLSISVVIPTFERPERLRRAVRSALEQRLMPREVLVCDDGSGPAAAREAARSEELGDAVRYVRLPENAGTPAAARNLGTRLAAGEWVAFLDDDDEWLPDKLSRQAEAVADHADADVVGTNALRGDGSAYFRGDDVVHRLARGDLLRRNPLVVSSVMVRRSALLAVGGFPEERWARGIADYATWLALADHGSRFLVVGTPLVRYEDDAADRMSARRGSQERALARWALRRLARRPGDLAQWPAMTRKIVAAAHVTLEESLGVRLHRRTQHAVGPQRRTD